MSQAHAVAPNVGFYLARIASNECIWKLMLQALIVDAFLFLKCFNKHIIYLVMLTQTCIRASTLMTSTKNYVEFSCH